VSEIAWRRGRVELQAQTPDGTRLPSLETRCALITVPVGVLQRSSGEAAAITFSPALKSKRRALEGLAMARVTKVVLDFRSAPWEHAPRLRAHGLPASTEVKFLHDRESAVPTWWTALPSRIPRLVAWSGGPAAERLAQRGDAMVETVLESLARLLGIDRSELARELQDSATHDWHADPFACGAYSYLRVGGGDAHRELAAPVEDTLFFAGEATCTDGRDGTVDGALASGHRAAREVRRVLAP
jgi:monoamine oxidase